MQSVETVKTIERTENEPDVHREVARRIHDIHSICVKAKLFLLLQIGSQRIPLGDSPSEDTRPPFLVFRDEGDFLSGFKHLRMAELAQAFIDGRMDVTGDIDPILTLASHLRNPQASFLEHIQTAVINQLSRVIPIAAAPDHYNLPPEVFELFLGKWQKYTGNYYPNGTETLDEAEEAAMALACNFMDVPEGGNHLEIGCGWGGQMEYIYTKRKAAHVVGLTDCPTQASYTCERLRRCGVAHPEVWRYGDFSQFSFDRNFDTISAVGSLEHIQPARYKEFFSFIYRALKHNGRFFLQTITKPMYKPNRKGDREGARFLRQHVFPGYQLSTSSTYSHAAGKAGLWFKERMDDSSDYVRTLRQWAERLQQNRGRIAGIVGEKQYRILLAYIAMGAKAFEEGVIDHDRDLYVKPVGQVSICDSRYNQWRGCGQWWTRDEYQCAKDKGGLSDCPPLSERIILAKKGPIQLAEEDFSRRWDENFRKKYPPQKVTITLPPGPIIDLTKEVHPARRRFIHERKPPW